jgi:spore germination protein GerM
VLTAIAIASTIAGCGVRTQADPEELNRDDVPFGLLEPGSAGASPEQGDTPFVLYFVDDAGALAPVVRTNPDPLGPGETLRELLAGPNAVEAELGLATAIPPGTNARAAVLSGDLVVIELAGSVVEASRIDAVAAIAQLVFTVTELGDVTQVLFRLADESVEVPRGDGTLTAGPVERGDYASLAP